MYALLQIESVNEERDGDEVTIRVSVTEIVPRRWNINLSKKSADQINKIRSLQGSQAMLPVEEGSFNGRAFMRLLDDPIIEVPNQGSKEKIVQPVQTEQGKSSLFSSKAN